MKTAFKIVLWSLICVSVGLAVWVAIDGSAVGGEKLQRPLLAEKTSLEVCMYWIYAMVGIAFASLLYAAITNFVCRPSGWIKTLISVGAVAAVVGASVGLALGQKITAADTALMQAHETSELGWRLSQIGIYAIYIVAGLTILAVLYSIVNGLVQKAINAFKM